MGIGLHPFIINQPFRQKYLDVSLEYIASPTDVWLTTIDQIAAHFKKSVPRNRKRKGLTPARTR